MIPHNKMYDTCQVNDCNKPHRAKGMCQMHYRRSKLYGSPNIKIANGIISDRDGYVQVRVIPGNGKLGKYKYQHRVVMEEHLKRELLPSEVVHHRNGVRTDNRIENLELWSKAQPPGQRVEDKVEYALEILRLYAPEYLSEVKA